MRTHALRNSRVIWGMAAVVGIIAAIQPALGQLPTPDHVVVVMEENHTYDEIIGAPNSAAADAAPYINNTLAPGGALFTNSHAIEHPSQPNYLDIYSGANQGVAGDNTSLLTPFTTANLGAELFGAGKTFADYSESLPYSVPGARTVAVDPSTAGATAYGYLGDAYSTDPLLNQYMRKHNPASNWQAANEAAPLPSNQLPATANQPFSAFPTGDFSQLPTVSFVIPNEQDDMHDGTPTQADTWLQNNIEAYRQWALTHNSLLIVTFDENDDTNAADPGFASNQIATIISGQSVIPGNYNELITHFNVLQTVQDFYGLGHAGATGLADGSANPVVTPITDIFVVPEPSSMSLLGGGGLALGVWGVMRRPRRAAGARGAALTAIVAVGAIFCFIDAIRANTLVAPNDYATIAGDTSDAFPLFSYDSSDNAVPLRYQQVYDSSQFAAFGTGGMITQISFRPDPTTGSALASTTSLQIDLSTTASTPGNLDPTFANNTGPDDTVVFGPGQALLTSAFTYQGAPDANANDGNPRDFDITITLTTPFLYNPSRGNLLLDVRNTTGGDSTPTGGVQLDGSIAGVFMSSAINFGNANATTVDQTQIAGGGVVNDFSNEGLITQFTFTPVPEPETEVVLGSGLAVALFLSVRRQRNKP